MKAKLIRTLTLLMLTFAITGCVEMTLSNLTPKRSPQNPSGIYTLTMKPEIRDANAIKESFKAYVVIDGEKHPMTKSSLGSSVYEYEYTIPSGRSESKYYFVMDYLVNVKGTTRERTETSELYTLELVNRYVVTMLSHRGPVGATVPVVGRGFSKYDKISIGDQLADTQFNSENSLTFTIPALPAGRAYRVSLQSGQSALYIGDFLIDASQIRVTPSSIEVLTGERTMVIFSTDNEAPASGILVDVTTDIPDSVIMPEVVITAGTRSISVPLEGGAPGEGSLYVSATGFKDVQIPVSVLSQDAPIAVDINETTIESIEVLESSSSNNASFRETQLMESNQQTLSDDPWAASNEDLTYPDDQEFGELPF